MSEVIQPLGIDGSGIITSYNRGVYRPRGYDLSLPPYKRQKTIVEVMSGQKRWMRPYVTKKDKYKKQRHWPYKRAIPRFIPTSRMGVIRWVGAEGTYQPAGQHGQLVYYVNSFYNPGAAVDASRVQWYSEIGAIYQRYRVVSAKVSMRLINTTADLVDCGAAFVMNDELPPTTAAGLTECIQKGSQFYIGATDENFSNHHQLERTWSLKKYVRNYATRVGDEYSAGVASNPAKLWCLVISFGSAANLVIKYRCQIEMVVNFFNLQQNAPD